MNETLEILYSNPEKGISVSHEPRTGLYWLSINLANFTFPTGFLEDYQGLDESKLVERLGEVHPLIPFSLQGENISIAKRGIEQARQEEQRRFESLRSQ